MSEKTPDKIIDKELYITVRKFIKIMYPKHSIYRSMKIIKLYKELGGKIKENYESGINKWLDEEWIVVYPLLKYNKKVKCGDSNFVDNSACRPSIRINDKTPITINELLQKFSKDKILKEIEIKNKDPQNYTMDWINMKAKRKNKK
jgi:hypothetical protein